MTGHALLVKELFAAGYLWIGGGLYGKSGSSLHKTVEDFLADHGDPAAHIGVAGPAHLGTLAVVAPLFFGGEVNVGGHAGNGIVLTYQAGHPERVDHIGRGHLEVHRLAYWHHDVVAAADTQRGVLDIPPELVAYHLDGEGPVDGLVDVGFAREHTLGGDTKDHQTDHKGNHSPANLEGVVVADLLGLTLFLAGTAELDDHIGHGARDHHKDQHRKDHYPEQQTGYLAVDRGTGVEDIDVVSPVSQRQGQT